MLEKILLVLPVALLTACAHTKSDTTSKSYASTEAPKWSMNATIIEACSCPMFCQCYFNSMPARCSAESDLSNVSTAQSIWPIEKSPPRSFETQKRAPSRLALP